MSKRLISAYLLSVVTLLSLYTYAADETIAPVSQSDSSVLPQPKEPPLTQLGNEFHNNIELLQNRFRIDYEVEEVTMIFFREYGSTPVVLVKPDGSKIFQSSANGEDIFWFDTATYDMVSLKKPTPGPWQAVGQIQDGSRVMVISDLALHADPLPNIVFSGEILKQTAYLTNNGVPIDYAAFRDVVELTITLASTNNPDFNNFGAKIETVATFEDDGRGMDEVPLDGVFTGQFNLAIADGEWIPMFKVSTPMYSREQVDPPIKLFANPIKVDVELDGGGDGYHKLKVDALREHVDISTLLIDGKVRFPNGDIQNFSITDMSADVREYLIVNYDYGVYRVKLTAYGNTVDGREFILDVPEYTFLSEEPEPEVIETAMTTDNPYDTTGNNLQVEQQVLEDEKMSKAILYSLVIAINGLLILVGGALIYWFILGRRPKFSIKELLQKLKPEPKLNINDETETEKPSGFFAKLFKRQPKVVKKAADETKEKPKQVNEGFKDLSI
ncbi:TIGR03503 family protein [Paraglaciecola marina]|uniref:TIGR03503 family protein n=1 Tax=Paraglaciecola marina TaxID=2500157 RepID=UPI00105BA95C|nr:TIGR03503 family protein [Paraglaciecola marina]